MRSDVSIRELAQAFGDREEALKELVAEFGCEETVKALGLEYATICESPRIYYVYGEANDFLCHDRSVYRLTDRDAKDVKLGLYELGVYGKIPKGDLPKVMMAALSCTRKQPTAPSITVDIRHVSEREELYYQIVRQILSTHIIKTFYTTTTNTEHELGMYCFDGLVYRPCEKEVTSQIQRLAGELEEVDKKTTRWVINEALFKIRTKTLTKMRSEPLKIAFENTIFDWEKFLETGSIRKSVLPPNPELVVFHKVPHKLRTDLLGRLEGLVKYSENLITNLEDLAQRFCPKTLKTFKEWVGDKWLLLFEIVGYTLYPRYDMHKAVMLVGEGRNGKSTYLRLVRDILGPRNVSSVKLQDLCDESKRFATAELYHKLANIYADLPSEALKYTGTFKVLTGEDQVTADRKFKDPITFVNYAKLLFSTNRLPKVSDMTAAFWRRWLVIEFPNQFPPNPSFYEDTFTEEEKEGTILVSLLAFRNVWVRRKFSFEGTEADYRELWLRETNSVYAFIQDLLAGKVEGYTAEKNPDSRVATSELYSMYVKYCEDEEREAVTKRIFTIEMERLGYKRVKVKGTYYYKGLTVRQKEQETEKLI